LPAELIVANVQQLQAAGAGGRKVGEEHQFVVRKDGVVRDDGVHQASDGIEGYEAIDRRGNVRSDVDEGDDGVRSNVFRRGRRKRKKIGHKGKKLRAIRGIRGELLADVRRLSHNLIVRVLKELRKLRNRVRHAPEPLNE
jgi:hypothetical protein